MGGETTDKRKRREELRKAQAAVQEQFNRAHAPFAEREDENPDVGPRCGECRLGLGGDHVPSDPWCRNASRWREDFPEPEWHKSFGDDNPMEGLPPVKGCTDTPCGECSGPDETPFDAVHQPEHYTHSRIEVWDAIDAWGLGYRLGNVIKYVARADRKGNPVQDLMKARAYLDREIATRQQDARDW